MKFRRRINEILERILIAARRSGKRSGFCIGLTRNPGPGRMYFTPLRQTPLMVAAGIIIYNAPEAELVARLIDGAVDYVLVDSEQKLRACGARGLKHGGIEALVRKVVRRSSVLTYKGNDLAVSSLDCLIASVCSRWVFQAGGPKAAIIGAGNIGSKLALRLAERGFHVSLTRRSTAKLKAVVRGLTILLPPACAGRLVGVKDNERAASGAHVLIGATPGIAAVTAAMIDKLAAGAVVIDAGKGSLQIGALRRARQRGHVVYRGDIRWAFEGHVSMLMALESTLRETTRRREASGVRFISGGLLGDRGEIVVDNADSPKEVYGIADGKGDFLRSFGPRERRALSLAQGLVSKNSAGSLDSDDAI